MINDVQATLVLDAKPIGTRIVATFIDEDGDATGRLLEHRESGGIRAWVEVVGDRWWTAREVTLAHDDMILVHLPPVDHEQIARDIEQEARAEAVERYPASWTDRGRTDRDAEREAFADGYIAAVESHGMGSASTSEEVTIEALTKWLDAWYDRAAGPDVPWALALLADALSDAFRISKRAS